MARLLASFTSGSRRSLGEASAASGSLQDGQRFAKPGLSGFSSNSSEQTAQVLTGKGITPLL